MTTPAKPDSVTVIVDGHRYEGMQVKDFKVFPSGRWSVTVEAEATNDGRQLSLPLIESASDNQRKFIEAFATP